MAIEMFIYRDGYQAVIDVNAAPIADWRVFLDLLVQEMTTHASRIGSPAARRWDGLSDQARSE